MYKLNMFQFISVKIDEFGWWDLENVSADAGKQFTLAEFKEECQTHRVHLKCLAPKHKEMNAQVEVTWRTMYTIEHSLMVHAIVLEA